MKNGVLPTFESAVVVLAMPAYGIEDAVSTEGKVNPMYLNIQQRPLQKSKLTAGMRELSSQIARWALYNISVPFLRPPCGVELTWNECSTWYGHPRVCFWSLSFILMFQLANYCVRVPSTELQWYLALLYRKPTYMSSRHDEIVAFVLSKSARCPDLKAFVITGCRHKNLQMFVQSGMTQQVDIIRASNSVWLLLSTNLNPEH